MTDAERTDGNCIFRQHHAAKLFPLKAAEVPKGRGSSKFQHIVQLLGRTNGQHMSCKDVQIQAWYDALSKSADTTSPGPLLQSLVMQHEETAAVVQHSEDLSLQLAS